MERQFKELLRNRILMTLRECGNGLVCFCTDIYSDDIFEFFHLIYREPKITNGKPRSVGIGIEYKVVASRFLKPIILNFIKTVEES